MVFGRRLSGNVASSLCGIWRPRATRSRSSLPGLWCRPRRRGSRTCAGRTSSAIWWLAPRSIVCTLRRALRFQKWTRWPYFLRLSGELRKTADDALNHIFETLVSATSARNAASNSVWGTNIVPQAMQMRLFAHCVTKARQKARHQLVVALLLDHSVSPIALCTGARCTGSFTTSRSPVLAALPILSGLHHQYVRI